MFLYNLFQIEITKFRRYFDDILLKNWIKHFISLTKIFIFFVFKKNNNFRLCVDYRNINVVIIKNRHSLSLIIEILNRLYDVVLFIKLNFINVYHRIKIKKKNEWKTTFRTRYEHFEYQIMFFELANAFAIFQIYINKILKKLINIFCVIYLNDILIYSSNSTKHWRYMRLIFERLKQYQLYINLKKCEFVITKIEFLNFIVFIKNVQINSKKIRIIQKWSLSKNYREFQIFLRFVNYYKRFIKNYFKLFVFFIDLLKKNKNDKKFEFFQ